MTSSRPNHDYACGMFVYKGELTTHSTEAERPHMAAVNIDFKNNRRAHAYATSLSTSHGSLPFCICTRCAAPTRYMPAALFKV